MSAIRMFTFFVMNDTTREIATFKGQGTTIEEAFKSGAAGLTTKFRADSNGGGTILPLNVRLPSGQFVARMKAEFESEKPFPVEEDCPV